jgi:hypothetical protein
MDAEPIVLPKICDVRSHFRVSIGDAILFVDWLKADGSRVAVIPAGMTKGDRGGSTESTCQAHLPALVPWPNLVNMTFRLVSPAGLPCCCMRTDAGDSGDWLTG